MPNDSQFNNQAGDFNGQESEPRPPANRLDRNQKIAAVSLAVFAFLVVILWSVQLKNNIYAPFNRNAAGLAEPALTSDQTADDLALKNKDTDADSLSDYDELNLYKTSPYLDDSDSDKLKDGEEIKNGTDPNCAQGRTCSSLGASSGAAVSPAGQSDILNNILNQTDTANPANQTGASGATTDLTDEQIQLLKNLDAASLRQILIESGMDKSELDKISDEELMQSYSETLNSQTGQ